MGIGSEGREALNFEVCDRLLGGGRNLVAEGSCCIGEAVAVEVGVGAEGGGMV